MRNIIVLMLVLGLALFAITKFAFPGYDKQVTTRVTNVFNGMQEGTDTNPKVETAMAMWAAGAARITDNAQLSWASDNFDKWRRAKKLYKKTGPYTIDTVEVLKDQPETAIVTVTMDGTQYKMRVPKGRPISWEE